MQALNTIIKNPKPAAIIAFTVAFGTMLLTLGAAAVGGTLSYLAGKS